jgi:hypothetical protein
MTLACLAHPRLAVACMRGSQLHQQSQRVMQVSLQAVQRRAAASFLNVAGPPLQ